MDYSWLIGECPCSRGTQKGLSVEVTFNWRPAWSEGESLVAIWEKGFSGWGNSNCQGTAKRPKCVECSELRKEYKKAKQEREAGPGQVRTSCPWKVFYSKCEGKILEGFQVRSDRTWLMSKNIALVATFETNYRRGKGRSRVAVKRHLKTQVWGDGGLAQVGSSDGGDKQLDSLRILWVELMWLADGRNLRYERKEQSKDTAMSWDEKEEF